MTDAPPPDSRPPWVLRIVRADGQGPAVRMPATAEPLIKVRVGLRNEAPIELTALRLFEGIVQLQAPKDLMAVATRTERTSGAIQRPVTGGDLSAGGSS